ncbi:hypothetical protein C3B59_10230 [Cryobacterium zongtaii]|uniref:Uncharacterized protein n=1 Tax=Cryobacterium zongtaii TaxID=1259217 RepID=A0A2S3ZD07_9MICO|nr:hypothetical protein C3B59_10230 [Cryobacterium zongtaii]
MGVPGLGDLPRQGGLRLFLQGEATPVRLRMGAGFGAAGVVTRVIRVGRELLSGAAHTPTIAPTTDTPTPAETSVERFADRVLVEERRAARGPGSTWTDRPRTIAAPPLRCYS